jgi:hypothetical protein
MNLKHILKKLTADARFERTGRGIPLRLANIDKPNAKPSWVIDSYSQLYYYDNKVGHYTLPKVEAWLKEYANGKYRVDNCDNTIVIHFSRDSDAVMYKLTGPYA